MKTNPTLMVLFALSTSPAVAFAEDKPDLKKLAQTPPAELTNLAKFFVGTWHCEGTATPPPAIGKPFAVKATTTYSLILDGFWLAAASEDEKTPGMPLPTAGKGEVRITFDRTTKSFFNVNYSNRGGYGTATSNGWEGDKLIWNGSASGLLKAEIRATITKKGDSEYHFRAERMQAGTWVTGSDVTCKKK